MTGFSAKYQATGTSMNAKPTWKYPRTTAPTLYAMKNPSGIYGSEWVKKDKGKGPKMAMSAAISRKKLPVMCMVPPDFKRLRHVTTIKGDHQ